MTCYNRFGLFSTNYYGEISEEISEGIILVIPWPYPSNRMKTGYILWAIPQEIMACTKFGMWAVYVMVCTHVC